MVPPRPSAAGWQPERQTRLTRFQGGRDTPYKLLVAPGNQHGAVSASGGRIGVSAAAALSRSSRAIDLALARDGKRAA